MNLLFLTAPEPPSLLHRQRALNLIKYLSRQHVIYLLSLTSQRDPNLEAIKPYCREVVLVRRPVYRSWLSCLAALPSGTPLEVAYCRDRRVERLVRAMVARARIDLIYIKRLRCAQYVPVDLSVPGVLDTTDAMSWYYEQLARTAPLLPRCFAAIEGRRYRGYERRMLARFQHWITCSPLDDAYLRQLAPPETSLSVVPNGVDTESFPPATGAPEPRTVLFFGLMDRLVNVQAATWLVEEMLPRLLRQVPDARLHVVGANPATAVRRLHGGRVSVTGTVPNLQPWIARAAVVVCPVLAGAGTRNKILQAWSVGRPVVTTPKGLEGLSAADGEHVLVGTTAEEFADQTARLLNDEGLRQRIAAAGLALVRQRYAMAVITRQLSELLSGLRPSASRR